MHIDVILMASPSIMKNIKQSSGRGAQENKTRHSYRTKDTRHNVSVSANPATSL